MPRWPTKITGEKKYVKKRGKAKWKCNRLSFRQKRACDRIMSDNSFENSDLAVSCESQINAQLIKSEKPLNTDHKSEIVLAERENFGYRTRSKNHSPVMVPDKSLGLVNNHTDSSVTCSQSSSNSMCHFEDNFTETRRYLTRSKNHSSDASSGYVSPTNELMVAIGDHTVGNEVKSTARHIISQNSKAKRNLKKCLSAKTSNFKDLYKTKASSETEISPPLQRMDVKDLFSESNICPICSMTLPDTHSLTLHIKEHNEKHSNVCQVCSKELSSASSLDRHVYTHSGERPFRCKYCKESFTTNGNMHRHMRKHEKRKSDQTSTSCESDNEETKRVKISIPEAIDKTESQKYKCSVCKEAFSSSELVEAHMKAHPNDPIVCENCHSTFDNYAEYKSHSCPIKERLPDDELGFRDILNCEFSMQKYSLIAKNACQEKTRQPFSPSFAFECQACGKAFPCERSLHHHNKLHNSSIGTFCFVCKCDFESEECLQDHQIKHTLEEKRCKMETVWNDTAETKENFLAALELHNMKSVNNMNDQSQEEIQSENLSAAANLPEEQKQPLKVKEETDLSVNLKSYNVENSNDFADINDILSVTSNPLPSIRASPITAMPASSQTTEQTDVMPQSPKNECSGSSFDTQQSQSAFEDCDSQSEKADKVIKKSCKRCNVEFQTSKALKAHMLTHSGNVLYRCQTKGCSYESLDRSTLHRHMRTHSGERPFCCAICGYAFTTKANSHRHVKKKHPNEKDVAKCVKYNPDMLGKSDPGNISDDKNKNSVCKYCCTDFGCYRALRHHLRAIHNSCMQKPFACQKCKLGFSTKNNCIRHINQKHPNIKGNIKDLIVVNKKPKITDDKTQVQELTNLVTDSNTEDERTNHSSAESTTVEDKTYSNETQDSMVMNVDNQNCLDSSHEDQTKNQDFCSEDDRVSIAQSLVSLSQGVPYESGPLDLSVRAIDLTTKNENMFQCAVSKSMRTDCGVYSNFGYHLSSPNLSPGNDLTPQPAHSTPVMSTIFEREGFNRIIYSPLNLMQNNNQNNSFQLSPLNAISVMCLPQTLPQSSPPLSNLENNPYVPKASLPPEDEEKQKKNDEAKLNIVKNKQGRARQYRCSYCFVYFTLKSNKQRHIKNKHPEYAAPSRSRNYVPQVATNEITKHVPSTLSDKTRNALLVTLQSKVNNNGPKWQIENNAITEKIEANLPAENKDSDIKIQNESFNIILSPADVEKSHGGDSKSDSENIDLASVSAVINTANSQQFNQYFNSIESKSCDYSPSNNSSWDSQFSSAVNTSYPSKGSKKKDSSKKTKKNIICDICLHEFPWNSSLERHKRTHTGEKPFVCRECPINFSTKSNRDRHYYRKHKINGRKSKNDSYSYNSPPSLQNITQKFSECISDNLTESTEVVSDFSDKSENPFDKSFEVDVQTAPNVYMASKTNLKEGIAVTQVKPELQPENVEGLECNFCTTSYRTNEDRTNHMKELHPLEFKALMGEEDVNSNDKLYSWKRKSMKNKKEKYSEVCQENKLSTDSGLLCCFCLQSFSTYIQLTEHVVKHSDDVSCLCTFCKKNLNLQNDLQGILKHLAEHLPRQTFANVGRNDATLGKRNVLENKFSNSLDVDGVVSQNHLISPTDHNLNTNIIPSENHNVSRNEPFQKTNCISKLMGFKDQKLIDQIENSVLTRVEIEA